jgi:hypothetical protein
MPERRKVLILFGRALTHFRVGISLGDEPGPDAGRYFANGASLQPVEPDSVELVFPRFFRNSDFHVHIYSDNNGLNAPPTTYC